MSRHRIKWLGAGEREIEKILRLGPDLDGGGMFLAALTDGVEVEGKLLPKDHAMVASQGDMIVLPDGSNFKV